MRIAILSHGHPSNPGAGGAEIASYQLFRNLSKLKNVIAFYISIQKRDDQTAKVAEGRSTTKNSNTSFHEISIPYDGADEGWLCHHWRKDQLETLLDTIKSLNVDIIHFHHILYYGLDCISQITDMLRGRSKSVLTFHDYRAICMNQGLMITRSSNSLCSQSNPISCNQCFPGESVESIAKTRRFSLQLINSFDCLISPSYFLRSRLARNGINHKKFVVIENCASTYAQQYSNTFNPQGDLADFAYFGNISEHKGLLILLEAVIMAKDRIEKPIKLNIYGGGLSSQPAFFQYKIKHLLQLAGDSVSMHGYYAPNQRRNLMQKVDWLIVPSIWWENSPLVILEAKSSIVPIIGSDAGGVKEKINGRGGVCFSSGDPESLSKIIEQCAGNTELHSCLQKQIMNATHDQNALLSHYYLYLSLL